MSSFGGDIGYSEWGQAFEPGGMGNTSPSGADSTFLGDLGMGMAVTGALMSAVGSFYAVQTQKYQAKSAALSLEFEASMANLNARAAEQDAQAILKAGQQEAGQYALAMAQEKESARTSSAAAGVVGGVGSAAEVQASYQLAKEIDVLTIKTNSVRAANNARMGAQDQRNRASIARTSAGNVRAGAGTLNPGLAAGGSLLGSAGTLASQWAYRRSPRY